MRCLDNERFDNLPGDKWREVSKIGRLKLGVGPGYTRLVFGQVKASTTAWKFHEFKR